MLKGRNKDSEELLLYLDAAADLCPACGVCSSEQGKTHDEVVAELNWSKDRVTKAIKDAEDHGMIKGDWEQHPDKEWVRRFFIAGEGTRGYIETLKKCCTPGESVNEIEEIESQLEDLKRRWQEGGFWNTKLSEDDWKALRTGMAWEIYSTIRFSGENRQ